MFGSSKVQQFDVMSAISAVFVCVNHCICSINYNFPDTDK